MVKLFSDNLIDQVFYINLDHRIDRNEHMQLVLNNMLNIPKNSISRFSAVDYSNHSNFITRCIGCAKSHLEIWKQIKQKRFKYSIIFEDDIIPIRPIDNINTDISELIKCYPNFDICNMAYSTTQPMIKDLQLSNFYHSFDIQTASAYILNYNFVDKLISITSQCINNLINNLDPNINAVDQCWKSLQYNNPMWFLMERSFKQIESYSDLEHRFVNYNL